MRHFKNQAAPVAQRNRKFRYTVTFADGREQTQKGITEAPNSEQAHTKVKFFWGRQAAIDSVEIEELVKGGR